MEVVVPSWKQHLLQRERMTKTEKDILLKLRSLRTDPNPPEEWISLSVSYHARQSYRQKDTLLRFWIEPDRQYILCRSNVPTDRQISLWRYRNIISASKFFL
jgi:hypothetical protein